MRSRQELEDIFDDWVHARLRLFVALLAPLVVAVPLRVLWFPDSSWPTVLVLAPMTEEAVKLAGVIAGLTLAAMIRVPTRRRADVLRSRLFWMPWVVGGLYGAYEAFVGYPREAPLDAILRIAGHASFTALGFATALALWRADVSPAAGILGGYGVAVAVHDTFNGFSLLPLFTDAGFSQQAFYALAILLVALFASRVSALLEPRTQAAAGFLLPLVRERP